MVILLEIFLAHLMCRLRLPRANSLRRKRTRVGCDESESAAPAPPNGLVLQLLALVGICHHSHRKDAQLKIALKHWVPA